MPWSIQGYVPSPNPAESSQLNACACAWSAEAYMYLLWRHAQGISSRGVRDAWSSGVTCGPAAGACRWCILQGLCTGLLVDSMRWVVESMTLCWVPHTSCSESLSLFPAPHCLLTTHSANILSVMGGVKIKWTSKAAREARHSLSPMGEITGQGDLSWHWAVLPLGRGYTGKVKLFFLFSSMSLFLDFFSNEVLEPLYGLLNAHKGILIMDGCQKSVFLCGDES